MLPHMQTVLPADLFALKNIGESIPCHYFAFGSSFKYSSLESTLPSKKRARGKAFISQRDQKAFKPRPVKKF
jgi:hypothetical protein